MQAIATSNGSRPRFNPQWEKGTQAPQETSPDQKPVVIVEQQHGHETFIDEHPVLVVVGSVVIVGGALWLIRRAVLKAIANREEKNTLDEDTPAAFAKRLKMAFENDNVWGTNMDEVRAVFREIPSKDFKKKVEASYRKLYNSSMEADLKEELQSTEYQEVLAIMSTKPDRIGKKGEKVPMEQYYKSWAKRLKSSFDKSYWIFPGTDEDAIKAVFIEMPTQQAFVETAKVYQSTYGTNMIDDLKGELEFWEYPEYMAIITSKRPI